MPGGRIAVTASCHQFEHLGGVSAQTDGVNEVAVVSGNPEVRDLVATAAAALG